MVSSRNAAHLQNAAVQVADVEVQPRERLRQADRLGQDEVAGRLRFQ